MGEGLNSLISVHANDINSESCGNSQDSMISSDLLSHALTAETRKHNFAKNKIVYDLSNLATLNQFYVCRIVVLRLFRLNIKA